MRESNSHQRFWRPLSYHLTNPLQKQPPSHPIPSAKECNAALTEKSIHVINMIVNYQKRIFAIRFAACSYKSGTTCLTRYWAPTQHLVQEPHCLKAVGALELLSSCPFILRLLPWKHPRFLPVPPAPAGMRHSPDRSGYRHIPLCSCSSYPRCLSPHFPESSSPD